MMLAMNMYRLCVIPLFVAACGSASGSTDIIPAAGSGSAGSAAAASCSMVATWKGAYSCPGFLAGKHYTWVMRADGTATGSIDGVGAIAQTWSLAKDTLTISEKNEHCSGDGKYTVTWGADCGTMKLSRISDACESRGACVDKLTSTRSK